MSTKTRTYTQKKREGLVPLPTTPQYRAWRSAALRHGLDSAECRQAARDFALRHNITLSKDRPRVWVGDEFEVWR